MHILAESYLHTLDPYMFRIAGDFGIRWYGVSYAVGFVIGWMMVRWMARTGRIEMPLRIVGDLVLYVVLGVLIGGRLGHALLGYNFAELWTLTDRFPYWELLAINRGGMASHGGIIGVIIASWLFARRHKIHPAHVFDIAAFACPPGLFLGRIANFINGELWGKALPASMQGQPPWWSIKYPAEIETWTAGQMIQIATLESAVSPGDGFAERVVDAAYRGNDTVIQTITPLLAARYPSQFFQAISDGPLLLLILVLIWLRPRKPGVIASWFLIAYGVMRLITEIFREPDADVTLKFGLQQGQLLSVGMVVAGAVGLVVSVRAATKPMGGLRASRQAPANV